MIEEANMDDHLTVDEFLTQTQTDEGPEAEYTYPVREAVAAHPGTPDDVRAALAADPQPEVRETAAAAALGHR